MTSVSPYGSVTNFPHGFSSTVTVLNQPILNVQSGNVWWVNSVTGNDGWHGTFRRPFATVARALGTTTAGTGFVQAGDTVMVAAGHAETISSATAVQFSVANVMVVCLGTGNTRPTFTLDTGTGTTINVTANGCGFVNARFMAGIAGIVSAFTLTTATGFTLDSCSFAKTSTFTFLSIVTTDTTSNHADDMTVVGCDWRDTATTPNYFVSMLGTNENMRFIANYISLGVQNDVTAGVNVAAGKLCTNFQGISNRFVRLDTTNTAGILFGTNGSTNSGIIDDNRWVSLVSGTPLWTPASSGLGFGVNYATGVADKSGFVTPTADS